MAVLCLNSCATYQPQSSPYLSHEQTLKGTAHTFYIAGGMGNQPDEDDTILTLLNQELSRADENSTLLFTGDNVTDSENNWARDKDLLNKQIKLTQNFKGNTIFIPGNNEWKSHETKKVERIEDYIKDLDREDIEFFPENACPIERKHINDNLLLILIDSKWFVTNWSRVEDINKKCTDIVTRRRFMEELEDAIDDNLDKNIVIAMHHPVFSNGEYAGHKTLKQHLSPIPIYGTLREGFMNLSAVNPEHLNSRRYNYLRILVTALAQQSDRVTVVSGHEENLQYLIGKNVKQIISGSLGSTSATDISKDKLVAIGGDLPYQGIYTHGTRGFAKLDYYKDGSSQVTFYSSEKSIDPIQIPVLPKLTDTENKDTFKKVGEPKKKEVILSNPDDYQKSGVYKFLWGERYRKYYGMPVTAPVAYLDTLYGGLKVTKLGGGHQSFSLRLEDKDGKQYAMRSLEKSALKFLKFMLPGISYNAEDYQDTWAEEVISDFFTTAHPYIQLVVDPLAKAVDINHSDTKLYYVPKQEGLGKYNGEFGNGLYYIERRPSEEQKNYKGYRRTFDEKGKVTDYESTTDMLEKIKSDESYTVDQSNFIRARVFDMLIGDWDRHQDQWRWIEYESENGDKQFMPIPKDRDNAFPRFDGFTLKFLKLFAPDTRPWQNYDDNIDDLKWFNLAGSRLDKALLNTQGTESWVAEAQIIQEKLTPTIIDKAFNVLPKEVQDESSEKIRQHLLQRLEKLDVMAKEYAEYLNRIVIVRGTEKDDKIKVTRQANGKTNITIERILSDEQNEQIYNRIFDKSLTKEVWVYGLGDDDVFVVEGEGSDYVKVKLIGGYGEDVYDIKSKKKLKIFDWAHEKIKFDNIKPRTQLSNSYTVNSYHWRYFKPNSNTIMPNLGFRADDGVFLGLTNTYTKNGLNGNPFEQKHGLQANYYFGFKALELKYNGIIGQVFPGWNFELDGYYTSDLYVKNFFGLGNETVNQEDQLDIDFYRARVQQFKASAGLAYYTLRPKVLFESFKVQELEDRFFTTENLGEAVFNSQNYVGAEIAARYDRNNADDFPTKAIDLRLNAGFKQNIEIKENYFGYFSFGLDVQHQLIASGDLVFATSTEYKTNIGGGDFFFYHAPSIGGDNGLRGFRDERFSGNSYFYQSSNLKYRLKRYITAVSPVTIGIYGGFDYGRVWVRNDTSNIWHTSQGGGLWISSLKALTFSLGYFNSKENNLLQVGFGISF